MNAREWGDRAMQALAAYTAEAEKVARGDRDADPAALVRLAEEAARADREARQQAKRETFNEWRPDHAPHVLGRWSLRVFDDDGMPEEQKVVITCDLCGGRFERGCSSGLVQAHISRFAVVHLHRDALFVKPRKVE